MDFPTVALVAPGARRAAMTRPDVSLEQLVNAYTEQASREAAAWIAAQRRVSLLRGLWDGLAGFWSAYLMRGGWRQGMMGFIRAYLYGLRQVIRYATYRELRSVSQPPQRSSSSAEGSVPPRTVPVSVVIITKNEEARLGACLATVGWANEVLVVDDESTDRTCALATEAGARVLTRRMENEGRHRNWAYAQASQPWVLSLDADEHITPALAHEIARTLRADPPYDAYDIPRKNYIGAYWVRHSGWYPSAQLRLFRSGCFRYEEVDVHPRALLDSNRAGALTEPMEHFSYRNFGDFLQKQNNHTTREARKWMDGGRRMTGGKALWRAIDRALRGYVRKQGFRDGFMGVMISEMAVSYQLLSYGKYREAMQGPSQQ